MVDRPQSLGEEIVNSITHGVALGIATLLTAVPVSLGVLHQLAGVGVLTTVVVAAHRARGAVAEG